MFRGFIDDSVLKRGQDCGAITIETLNIRDFSTDKHHRVDDIIYGGGPGMLLKPQPVAAAIRTAKDKFPQARVIYLSPSGETFTQRKAEEIVASGQDIILLCGRYEGLDQRVRAMMIDEEISIGDYVLSGGEVAAAVIVDTVARLVPGVVGKAESTQEESFSRRLFRCAEFPQFTRPESWEGLQVPDILLSGNHAAIEEWQLDHLPGLTDSERKILVVRHKSFPRKTKRLLLRIHEESDIACWVDWLNDPEVVRFTSVSPPITHEDEADFFDSIQANLHTLPISICDRKSKTPIGVTSLQLDTLNLKSAEFGIIIGDKSFWGQGICRETLNELLRVAFEDMGLERVHLNVYVENTNAMKCYESCGMRKIGMEKKKFLKADDFHDAYVYEILKDDFSRRS